MKRVIIVLAIWGLLPRGVGQVDSLVQPEIDFPEYIELYKEEFRKLYGKDGKVSETVEAAIEKALPIIETLTEEAIEEYNRTKPIIKEGLHSARELGKEIARKAVKKSKPVVDAYVQEFRTLYWGSDSVVAKKAREAYEKAKPVVKKTIENGKDLAVELGERVKKAHKEYSPVAEDFVEDYKREFTKTYIGPDSRLSQTTEAAIEKAKPILDAYIREFKRTYVGKDSKAAEAIRYAIKKGKPLVDAYVNEFKSMYIGDDSTVAQLAREGLKQAKEIAQGYPDEFKRMYGRDSTVQKTLRKAYAEAVPLGKAYGEGFRKMYVGKDSTARKAARKIGHSLKDFAREKVLPTFSDWVGWDESDVNLLASVDGNALVRTALGDEDQPIQLDGKKFILPVEQLEQLSKKGLNINEPDPKRLVVLLQPDGFAVATYGLTPLSAAAFACNPVLLQKLISLGAKVTENPLILTAVNDREASMKLSGYPEDLVRFRMFALKSSDQSSDVQSKLKKCEQTRAILEETRQGGSAGRHYSREFSNENHYSKEIE